MLLLAIDSSYLGHYDNRFNSVHNAYLEIMGFTELIDLLNRTKKFEYEWLQDQYNTKAKIKLDKNRYLQTKLPLAELQGFFGVPLILPDKEIQT